MKYIIAKLYPACATTAPNIESHICLLYTSQNEGGIEQKGTDHTFPKQTWICIHARVQNLLVDIALPKL